MSTRFGAASSSHSVFDRIEQVSSRNFLWLLTAIFFAISLLAYWPMWPGDPHMIAGCACGDSLVQSWFLGFTPWALLHGHNPFFTTYIDFPKGVNLASNTLMPLLGVIFAPVTLLSNAVSTFNLLMWLAFPLSALSASYVVRRWTGSNVGSFFAGVVYGFSPYINHQAYGHLNLTFVPLPPLIFYATYQLAVVQRGDARRRGAVVGLLAAAQYLISAEIFASTAAVVAVAFILSALGWRKLLTRERLEYFVQAGFVSVLVIAVFIGYPVWCELFGVNHVVAPAAGGYNNPYRADFLASVIPSSFEQFAPSLLTKFGDRFTNTAIAENGSYLGLPLVLLYLGCLWRWRKNGAVTFAGLMAMIMWIFSLGPFLTILNHPTSVPLPYQIFARLPLLINVLASRLSLFVAFFVGLTVALSWAAWRIEFRNTLRPTSRPKSIAVLLVVALIPLTPRWPLPTGSISGITPSFFTSSESRVIPKGAEILTFPYLYPMIGLQPYVWQLTTNWNWKVMGAYAMVPGPSPKDDYPWPWPTPPISVTNYFVYWNFFGTNQQITGPQPTITKRLRSDVLLFVRRYHISAIVVALNVAHNDKIIQLISDVYGHPKLVGGVAGWFHLNETHSA